MAGNSIGFFLGIIGVQESFAEEKPPSLKSQIREGVLFENIICNEGMALVLKSSNNSPSCVKQSSVVKLEQREWALSKTEQANVLSSSSEIMSEHNVLTDTQLNITSQIIGEKNYFLFKGLGWNNLHNVEITITGDHGEKITSMRSKTNDNGLLYVLWPLPDDDDDGLSNGFYNVHATDGINENELKIRISDVSPEHHTVSSELEVEINGEKQARRGTTHFIEVQVFKDKNPVERARVFITIEDYGKNIIREFRGHTNQEGYFVFAWEIPQRFDDVETLLAFVDVSDGNSSKTNLFKFQVYCHPGEKNCQTDGN